MDSLLYLNKAGIFEARQLDREVPSCEARNTFEKEKVRALAGREYGEDGKPCRFVNHAVDLRHSVIEFNHEIAPGACC